MPPNARSVRTAGRDLTAAPRLVRGVDAGRRTDCSSAWARPTTRTGTCPRRHAHGELDGDRLRGSAQAMEPSPTGGCSRSPPSAGRRDRRSWTPRPSAWCARSHWVRGRPSARCRSRPTASLARRRWSSALLTSSTPGRGDRRRAARRPRRSRCCRSSGCADGRTVVPPAWTAPSRLFDAERGVRAPGPLPAVDRRRGRLRLPRAGAVRRDRRPQRRTSRPALSPRCRRCGSTRRARSSGGTSRRPEWDRYLPDRAVRGDVHRPALSPPGVATGPRAQSGRFPGRDGGRRPAPERALVAEGRPESRHTAAGGASPVRVGVERRGRPARRRGSRARTTPASGMAAQLSKSNTPGWVGGLAAAPAAGERRHGGGDDERGWRCAGRTVRMGDMTCGPRGAVPGGSPGRPGMRAPIRPADLAVAAAPGPVVVRARPTRVVSGWPDPRSTPPARAR